MLGFRGHFASKSRRYSVNLGVLRRARRRAQILIAQSRDSGRPLDLAALRADLLAEEDAETTLVVGHRSYVGSGWVTEAERVLATAAAAARAREYGSKCASRRAAGAHHLCVAQRRIRASRTSGGQAASLSTAGRARLGGVPSDGSRRMKPLGLGERCGITLTREGSGYVAYVRYRDYAGRGRRLKRSGPSNASASRNVLRAVREALGADGGGEITRTSTLQDAARGG